MSCLARSFTICWLGKARGWRVSCTECGWSQETEFKRQATGLGFRHIGLPDPPRQRAGADPTAARAAAP